jgi:hypothetical protein
MFVKIHELTAAVNVLLLLQSCILVASQSSTSAQSGPLSGLWMVRLTLLRVVSCVSADRRTVYVDKR